MMKRPENTMFEAMTLFFLVNNRGEVYAGRTMTNEPRWVPCTDAMIGVIFTNGFAVQAEWDAIKAAYPELEAEILEYYF
jgi:hypothetical protein